MIIYLQWKIQDFFTNELGLNFITKQTVKYKENVSFEPKKYWTKSK